MKCTDAENLLGLYVRSDLDGARQAKVAAHIESCAHCGRLAEEYKEVQQWTRLYAPPEFSEEFFEGIRSNVLKQISQGNEQPRFSAAGWSATIAGFLRGRASAMGYAAIIVLMLVAGFLVYSGRTVQHPEDTIAKQNNSTAQGPSRDEDKNTSAPVDQHGLIASGNHHQVSGRLGGNSRRYADRSHSKENSIETVSDNLVARSGVVSNVVLGAPEQTSHMPAADDKPLRVEIQTADPTLRIIWFTSRPSEER